MRPISAYWQKLGFSALSYTHPPLSNLRYRGGPPQFDQELGWQRHSHHLAFQANNLDKAIASWAAAGFPAAQSSARGEEGKAGSGRFAYVDTDSIGGVTRELLGIFNRASASVTFKEMSTGPHRGMPVSPG